MDFYAAMETEKCQQVYTTLVRYTERNRRLCVGVNGYEPNCPFDGSFPVTYANWTTTLRRLSQSIYLHILATTYTINTKNQPGGRCRFSRVPQKLYVVVYGGVGETWRLISCQGFQNRHVPVTSSNYHSAAAINHSQS